MSVLVRRREYRDERDVYSIEISDSTCAHLPKNDKYAMKILICFGCVMFILHMFLYVKNLI